MERTIYTQPLIQFCIAPFKNEEYTFHFWFRFEFPYENNEHIFHMSASSLFGDHEDKEYFN